MFDINFNINSIFNCFLPKEAQIKIIMSRTLNGTYDFVFLNQIDIQPNISISSLGHFDFSRPVKIKSHLIPIYINKLPKYSLVLASKKNLKEAPKELVELL